MSEGTTESSGTVNEQGGLPGIPDTQPPMAQLAFDPQEYLKFMDGLDLTLEEKIDALHTLWKMMSSFVDRAWGVDSVQLLPAWQEFTSRGAQGTLTIEAKPTDSFNDAAPVATGRKDRP